MKQTQRANAGAGARRWRSTPRERLLYLSEYLTPRWPKRLRLELAGRRFALSIFFALLIGISLIVGIGWWFGSAAAEMFSEYAEYLTRRLNEVLNPRAGGPG